MSGGRIEACDAPPLAAGLVGSLDPRTRLLAALAIIATILTLDSLATLAAALAGAGALVALAGLPARTLRHRLLHVEGFMLVLFVLLPVTTPGPALWSIGPVSVSAEGLHHAAVIALKVNTAVLTIFALLSAVEPARLGHAAARLGAPLKLVHLFLFVLRYIALFRGEWARLLEAMKARAFAPAATRHCWRSLGNLVGMMLVRALERAERVDEAMRCRAFCGRVPLIGDDRPGRADLIFAPPVAALLLALLIAEHMP